MSILILVGVMALFLAYSNGANDNFKGVATLWGSNTASYRDAITLATIATAAGSISSVFLAATLIKTFSGSGVVPPDVAGSPIFLAAVAAGAAGTVALATLLGLPISTTHGLTGAIIGAGFLAVGTQLNLGVLGSSFFAPLLVSPVLAILMTVPLYHVLHFLPARFGVERATCVCLGAARFVRVESLQLTPGETSYAVAVAAGTFSPIVVAAPQDCVEKYYGQLIGVSVQRLVDLLHYLSAAAVSFARGLNDTPKIVALLLVVQAFDIRLGTMVVGVAMAIGGLLNARKVAHTMSKKISRMNDGQALTANLVTAFLVIFASRQGVPVSTTHVSVGAITGIGLVNGSADKSVISKILASWLLTIPIAAAIGGATYAALYHAFPN